MIHAVILENLSKIYKDGKKAVDSISLRLEPGEVFGFLGPNGAGKTTTVKLLNGMLTPTEGSCQIFGINPSLEPEKVHAHSGVLTEHAQMYDHLTGLENLVFYGSVFGLSVPESKRRGMELLEELELADSAHKKLSSYSTGMRQRLSLARAMIHEPQILFLDEPTSGLDPKSAQSVHTLIQKLAAEKGTTVFLCTHQLRYAQEICTRYGLMDQGRLLAKGTLSDLRKQIPSPVRIKLQATGWQPFPSCKKLGENLWEMTGRSEEEIPAIVKNIVEQGGKLYHISSELPSLEDIYFHLTAAKKENTNYEI